MNNSLRFIMIFSFVLFSGLSNAHAMFELDCETLDGKFVYWARSHGSAVLGPDRKEYDAHFAVNSLVFNEISNPIYRVTLFGKGISEIRQGAGGDDGGNYSVWYTVRMLLQFDNLSNGETSTHATECQYSETNTAGCPAAAFTIPNPFLP